MLKIKYFIIAMILLALGKICRGQDNMLIEQIAGRDIIRRGYNEAGDQISKQKFSISKLDTVEGLAILAGNQQADGSEPLAMAYSGHQFGGFSPQLGDGRAILLGEVVGTDDVRRDIQLKGSGPTPFSRRGDGRSALGPVLREYIVSEAMAALGVPTTRALAAVASGEPVVREGAISTYSKLLDLSDCFSR